MKLIELTKEFFKTNKKSILISIILLSIGSFFIHLKQNQGVPNLYEFFIYLPLSWLALIGMGLMIALFLYGGKY